MTWSPGYTLEILGERADFLSCYELGSNVREQLRNVGELTWFL